MNENLQNAIAKHLEGAETSDIVKSVLSVLLIIAAMVIAATGHDGWGWCLFIAVILL